MTSRATPSAKVASLQTSLPNLVVFYLETTGFTPDRHEIIQIAAVRLATDGSIVDTFFTHVRPRFPVPRHVTVLTGIRNADVAGAPAAPEALRAFARFFEDARAGGTEPILVAHNGHRFGLRFIDSIWLARTLWPTDPLHNLDTVAERLGIDVNAPRYRGHDARSGVQLLATAVHRMVQHLLQIAPAKQLQAETREHDFIATP